MKDYSKLYWRIIATTLCFSFVPLVMLGASLYHQFSVSYTAKAMENLRTMATNRRDAIDLFLDERVAQLTTLANTLSLEQIKDQRFLDQLFTLIQSRSRFFIDLGIIDDNGDHIAYVGPYKLKGLNYRDQEWFNSVALRGVYISDVFMGFRNFPHFIIAVHRREGQHHYILRATIDSEIFQNMVQAARVGMKGDAFVINTDQVLQTKPKFEGDILTRVELPKLERFIGNRLEELQSGGTEAIYAFSWLRNKDWLLVIKEDTQEELMPLNQAKLMAIGVLALGVTLIIVGTMFLARLMVAQLIQADREKAALDAGLVQSSKMAALGKLAAGIAHEVNNPLAVIKEKIGWMQDLLTEEDVAKSKNMQEFEDAAKKIDFHVDRAKKVTHRLLGFARRMEPVREQVDINKLVDETLDFLRNEAHYRNINIVTDYCADLKNTVSDSSQLQQVFLNILNNAIDAVEKNGEVRVSTRLSRKDQEIIVTISDNGPGIPDEVLQRIFDPFFTTKEVGKGTGLGLSISYNIIQNLGGRIMVASEKSKGTDFTIYLPVVTPEKA